MKWFMIIMILFGTLFGDKMCNKDFKGRYISSREIQASIQVKIIIPDRKNTDTQDSSHQKKLNKDPQQKSHSEKH